MHFNKVVFQGLFWSLTKNWGGRLLSLAIFTVLARFLGPEVFGLGSMALLIVMFAGMLAGFGFCDAIVQAPSFAGEDANLPFYIALISSVLTGAIIFFNAYSFEAYLALPGLGTPLKVMCWIVPIVTVATFQEAIYRRNLDFRRLAIKVLLANLVAGPIAVVCAWVGMGIWSLIVQAYAGAIVGLLWLWQGSNWKPGMRIRTNTLKNLTKFAIPVVSGRMLDFLSVRLVDIMIVSRFGVIALGLYAVSHRIQRSLMMLLQSSIIDVALPVLSKISEDTGRMAQVYIRTTILIAYLTTPIFILGSLLLPRMCSLIFGAEWVGIEEIATPLLLLGGVQCVQFLNGPYLSAIGRPDLVFYLGVLRTALIGIGLTFVPTNNLVNFVHVFILLQVLTAPISFYITAGALRIPIYQMFSEFYPVILSNIIAYYLATFVRGVVNQYGFLLFLAETLTSITFVLCFSACALLLGRRQVTSLISFIRNYRQTLSSKADIVVS